MSVKEMLKEKQNEILGRGKLEFPFPKLVVDHGEGKFRLGGTRNEEGEIEGAQYFETVSLVILKRYGEYFRFNPDTERVDIRTTIEENPVNAVEVYSRVPVSELKENYGDELKYLGHYIALLKTDDGLIPVDFQAKGAVVKSIIDFLTKDKDYARNMWLYKLNIGLKKAKKGAVKYYVLEIEKEEVSEEEAKEILEKSELVIEEFEEFRKAYNSRRKQSTEDEEIENMEEETTPEGVPF